MLLQALGGGAGENDSSSSSEGGEEAGDSTALERMLLQGADKFLLADITKLAEAAAVDPLDEVLKYDDESGEGWAINPEEDLMEVVGGTTAAAAAAAAAGGGGGGGDKAAVAAVDIAVQQRCQLTRRVVQKLAQRLQEVAAAGGGAGGGSTVGASTDNQARSGAMDGQSPPGKGNSNSSSLVEGTQRLQAQVEMFRDRLVLAKRNQQHLYKGLIRALKERHRYRRAEDWGLAASLEEREEGMMKMEEEEGGGDGGREGRNGHHCNQQQQEGGSCGGGGHGEHKAGGQHKRKRSLAGAGGGSGEEEGGSVSAAELEAAVEGLQELRDLAEKRGEELEMVREEKAGLNRRLTTLLADQAAAAAAAGTSSRGGGGGGGMLSEEQLAQQPLYRQLCIERDGLRREGEEGGRCIESLRQEVGDLKGKLQMLAQSRQEAIEAERRHFVARTDELFRENQQLKRVVDEYSLEVEAKRVLVRQADELKAALDDQRAEAGRVRAISTHQAAELVEVRAQWAKLQERLTGREEEVTRLSQQVLSQVPPEGGEGRREGRIVELEKQLVEAREEKERLAAFQTSLFEETESLTAAYEELSGSMQRLKTQVEEKERRNNRLQDELMRTKATEQLQVERAMALERRQLEFERVRLEQQMLIKEMQEVISMLKGQSAALAQAKGEAEEEVLLEARRVHQAQRTAEEATAKLEGVQNKANAMTRRAEELGMELDSVEKARFSLQEQVNGLTRKLQKAQTKLEASSSAGGGGGGGGGGGAAVGAVGGGNAAQNETLLKLLNCSVCNVRWKDCVITKCYHLFCQPCIQSNLKVRSRKCPACGKHFSESDVKPIFLT